MDLSFLAVMLLILFWTIGPHSLLKVTIYLLVVFGIALIAPISRGSTRAAVVSAWTWWIHTAWPWLVKAALSPWTTAVLGLLLAAGCLLAFLFTGHQVLRMARELITDEMDLPNATWFLTFVLGARPLSALSRRQPRGPFNSSETATTFPAGRPSCGPSSSRPWPPPPPSPWT
ncbi:hypothetical protein ACIBF6_21610 [Streptosporangium amethystogenes]|uniref:hypothetical protein n=1 Tax=Streptosporangium amethystogenes TaxID=2002 RepID=UPI0037A1EB3E